MKNILFSLALLISFFLLFSCSTPDWEKRGFKNKAEYEAHLLDSLWLNDDEKFVGVYTGVEEGGVGSYMYEKTFTMQILEDGTGKFDEEERLKRFKHFLKYMGDLDRIRDTRYFELVPELKKWHEKYYDHPEL